VSTITLSLWPLPLTMMTSVASTTAETRTKTLKRNPSISQAIAPVMRKTTIHTPRTERRLQKINQPPFAPFCSTHPTKFCPTYLTKPLLKVIGNFGQKKFIAEQHCTRFRSSRPCRRSRRPAESPRPNPDAIRSDLKNRGIKPVIPARSNRTATIRYNRVSLPRAQLH